MARKKSPSARGFVTKAATSEEEPTSRQAQMVRAADKWVTNTNQHNVEELQRIWMYALYLSWGVPELEAALRAGYAPNAHALTPEFLAGLTELAYRDGWISRVEVPFEDLLESQQHKSLMVVAWLRDHSMDDRVRLDASKLFLNLAGRNEKSAVPIKPMARLKAEMRTWTEEERATYSRTGELPRPKPELKVLADKSEVAEEAQPAAPKAQAEDYIAEMPVKDSVLG